jgi:hypothetical protein
MQSANGTHVHETFRGKSIRGRIWRQNPYTTNVEANATNADSANEDYKSNTGTAKK